MIIRYEIVRLFGLWINELRDNGEWLQASIIEAVLNAFLIWYDE